MHSIEIIDDLMCVMDEDGDGYDCHVLVNLPAAEAQVQAWLSEYTFEMADARQKLQNFFSESNQE